MLVISREIDQSIMIGDDLRVEVVELTEDSVSLRVLRFLIGDRLTEEDVHSRLKRDQNIDLGNEIQIAIVDLRPTPHKVRLGIHAPKYVSIHRKEVYDAIRREIDEANGFNH